MSVPKVQMERLIVVSDQPFEAVTSALQGAIGRPEMPLFLAALKSSSSYGEVEKLVERSVRERGLMTFMKLDAASLFRFEPGFEQRKAQRFLTAIR